MRAAMQIVPLPPIPQNATALPPATITSVLPQIQAQAVAPIGQQAVAPTPKSEKEGKSRFKDEEDGPRQEKPDESERGGHLNISV
jgi:hypothetical protein